MKKKTLIVLAVVIVLAFVLGGSGYFFYKTVIKPHVQTADATETVFEPLTEATEAPTEREVTEGIQEPVSNDYIPEGTAVITTVYGDEYTAIANSLTMWADNIIKYKLDNDIYSGLDNELPNDYDGDYQGENMVYFTEMESVERVSDALNVKKTDGTQITVTPPEAADLWYIGESDLIEPNSLLLSDIQSITFDRNTTPDYNIIYAFVSANEERFYSPVAYIWFTRIDYYNFRFEKNLDHYTEQPVNVENMRSFYVKKQTQRSFSDTGSKPESIEAEAELLDGTQLEFEMNGFFSFRSMKRNGELASHYSYNMIGIDFDAGNPLNNND